MKTRFIIVAGGVISGVGKGVTTAAIGRIIKEYGYKTTLIKIDPYINCDAGTLRPTEHGEVWVTDDGGEIDQDLGTYERFISQAIPKHNNITTGQIYKTVIDRERAGEYLGQTVQFIPHIINEVQRRIQQAAQGYEVAVIEIGGTVGDYENAPFLFACKALERDLGSKHVVYVLVTYLPIPDHIDEMKTKPTLQAVRLLGQEGILPDFIVCRSSCALDALRRKKIVDCAHIPLDHVISAPDISNVYQLPLDFEQQQLGKKLLSQLKLTPRKQANWSWWRKRVESLDCAKQTVRIAIVGKYLASGSHTLTDSYISIYHALVHAGAELGVKVEIVWCDAQTFTSQECAHKQLADISGIIIPGGFGTSGTDGKVCAITYARKNNIPYIGLCYGLQLAVIEFARNVCNLTDAHTTEIDEQTPHPVITMLPAQHELLANNRYGGTMRLGAYQAVLKPESLVHQLYAKAQCVQNTPQGPVVSERHRHRYEVNPNYVAQLEKNGLVFSGHHVRTDGTTLMEFLELPDHPFFIATQAHPEFNSKFGAPNPLFYGFVHACMQQANMPKKDIVGVQRVHTVDQANL